MRINVDLPQPEGPIRAVTVPAAKSSDTSASAWCLPNHACTPRASRPVPIGCEFIALRLEAEATEDSDEGVVVVSILSLSPLFSVDIYLPTLRLPRNLAVENRNKRITSRTSKPVQARAIDSGVPDLNEFQMK